MPSEDRSSRPACLSSRRSTTRSPCPDGSVETLFSTEFHRIDLRWDHHASDDTDIRLAATVGMDRTRGDEDQFFLRDRLTSVRSEIRHRISKQALFRSGTDLTLDHYDVQLPPPEPGDEEDDDDREVVERLFPPRSDVAIGTWADVVLAPERLSLFFPVLLFGILREKRGGIGAAVWFHALSNLLSEVLTRGYL